MGLHNPPPSPPERDFGSGDRSWGENYSSDDPAVPNSGGGKRRTESEFTVASWGGGEEVGTPGMIGAVEDTLEGYSPGKPSVPLNQDVRRKKPYFNLGKKKKLELKNMRVCNDVMKAVFQCVWVLFEGKGRQNEDWYDCRDFVVNLDFNR